jgi:hypothetical protein
MIETPQSVQTAFAPNGWQEKRSPYSKRSVNVGGGDFRGHFRRDKGAMGASLRSCREAGDNTTPPPSEAAAFANPMGGDAVSTLHQFLNPV